MRFERSIISMSITSIWVNPSNAYMEEERRERGRKEREGEREERKGGRKGGKKGGREGRKGGREGEKEKGRKKEKGLSTRLVLQNQTSLYHLLCVLAYQVFQQFTSQPAGPNHQQLADIPEELVSLWREGRRDRGRS